MDELKSKTMRVGAILAGGGSARMGGADKALAKIGGARLVDLVIARLASQVDRLLISGNSDYETGLKVVQDATQVPKGPAGGVISIARYLAAETPAQTGFITAPVDGPFFPEDLVVRLSAYGTSAIAGDGQETHPTFAYWTVDAVMQAASEARSGLSLKRLAELSGARVVRWERAAVFANINTLEDLRSWEGSEAAPARHPDPPPD